MGYFDGTRAEKREYQERICSTTTAMLDGSWRTRDGLLMQPAKSVLINAPVGSGKTVMALALGQHAYRTRKMKVGIVAMRRNLLTQARQMRDELGFDIPNMEFVSMFDQDPPRDIDLMIVDEAQHDSTHSMARIHGLVKPKMVIGLTATPFRTDSAQLAFDRVVKDVGIHYLISEGFLSQYDHYTIPVYSPQTVADLFKTFPGKWGKSLIFFLTMDDCRAAQAALAEVGVTSELVWGRSDREAQLEAFEAGKIQVLISMSILTEGFDAPDLQTVFIRPSSKLPAIQMGGRVLRKHPDMPIKQIVQCQMSNHPFIRTAGARTTYIQVGNEFHSLAKNEKIEQIAWTTAQAVLQAKTIMPSFIKKGMGKRRTFYGRGRRGRGPTGR